MLSRTLEELRTEVARERGVSETVTIFNQDLGEIKDVSLLRNEHVACSSLSKLTQSIFSRIPA